MESTPLLAASITASATRHPRRIPMRPDLLTAVISLASLLYPICLPATPQPGATLDAVIEEKGQPTGRAGFGSTQILTYPDETIVLKDGKVTEVRPASEVTTVPDRKISEAEKRRVAADEAAAAREQPSSSASWSTDYDSALSTAKSQGRKVFLFFTGSDWCGWCIKLNREILSQPEFAAYAADNLVLVELDFPRTKPLPADQRARNEALARKYGVRGYPTVIVLDSNGKVAGKLGYQAGGPGPFVAALRNL